MRKSTNAITWIVAVALGWGGSEVYKRVAGGSRTTVEKRAAEYAEAWKKARNDVARVPAPNAEEALARAPRWQRNALKPKLAQLDTDNRAPYEGGVTRVLEIWQGKFRGQWEEALDDSSDPPAIAVFLKETNLHEELKDRLKKLLVNHDADMRKKHPRIRLAIDSFSGYCVFRSREFHNRLVQEGIKLHLVDDGADYKKRIKTLQSNDTPIAVFTVDALINNSALLDEPPATIVAVVDETRGADAMVADGRTFPNLDTLNRNNVKIVLTPDSPSETLARVVLTHCKLPLVPRDWIVQAKDAEDVLAQFRQAKPGEPRAYVLWEPYVSKLLKEFPHARVLIDSKDARLSGYIVDVLVVNRKYLRKNPETVRKIVKAYLEASQLHQRSRGDMIELVMADARKLVKAKKLDKALTVEQATKVVEGIWWKTTDENYAHFGLPAKKLTAPCKPLDEIIKNLNTVLIRTSAISRSVKPELLYDPSICAQLQGIRFDPKDDPWKRLKPAQTPFKTKVEFARGSTKLPDGSDEDLKPLVDLLKKDARLYLEVRGHATGVTPADRVAASERATAVAKWLKGQGVSGSHIRTVAAVGGTAPAEAAVTFALLQTGP